MPFVADIVRTLKQQGEIGASSVAFLLGLDPIATLEACHFARAKGLLTSRKHKGRLVWSVTVQPASSQAPQPKAPPVSKEAILEELATGPKTRAQLAEFTGLEKKVLHGLLSNLISSKAIAKDDGYGAPYRIANGAAAAKAVAAKPSKPGRAADPKRAPSRVGRDSANGAPAGVLIAWPAPPAVPGQFDPTIDALLEKRAAHVKKAQALDTAIRLLID